MNTTDFTFTINSNQTPEQVFKIINDVRSWWSGIYSEKFEGPTEKLNDEFSFTAENGVHYSKHKLIEVIPNRRIVWQVIDGALSFVEKKDEWIGTQVIFDILEEDGTTKLKFTHHGLTPQMECYEACSGAWSQYLKEKLSPMITNK